MKIWVSAVVIAHTELIQLGSPSLLITTVSEDCSEAECVSISECNGIDGNDFW